MNFWLTNRDRIYALSSPAKRDKMPSCHPAPPIPAMTQIPFGLNLSFVAKTLQCGDRGHRGRSRLLEAHIGRFQDDCSIRQNADILSEGAVFSAENFVAWFEVRDVFANCFDDPRVVDTQSSVF